jgi:hypothetical protein
MIAAAVAGFLLGASASHPASAKASGLKHNDLKRDARTGAPVFPAGQK